MNRQRFLIRTILAAALASAGLAMAQGAADLDRSAAQVARAEHGRPLAVALARTTPQALLAAHLRSRGRGEALVASLRSAGTVPGAYGVTHLRMEQVVDGLVVHGAYLRAAVNARGELVHLIERLAPVSTPAASRIGAAEAVRTALARLYPGQAVALRSLGSEGNTTAFDAGALFHGAPSATAVALRLTDGNLARGWLVETWSRKGNALHHTVVSGDGRVLDIESRTARDSYNVFAIDPGKSPQTVVSGPGSGNAESPAGWLGSGAQTTLTISGNNTEAYLDADANNRADRGGTPVAGGDFVTSANLFQQPGTAANRAVSVQNLFYLNNVIHDILFRNGFVEAAGNFQQDNFGKGGRGGDPVHAEAQDGAGTDNANFATPRDGRSPRMQMFLFTGAGATHRVLVSAPAPAAYGAMGADFGPALDAAGITGDVVAALDGGGISASDGCEAITTPLSGKVALIDRGGCEFTLKVLNAQRAGAAAVIVANNTGGDAAFTMGAGSGAKRVRIPAVMIGQNDGAALRATSAPNATVSKLAVQPLQIDAALDSDIVYHEYGHGLTWRMIGGMSGPLAGAIGEGMSDGIAMLVNGDDVVGEYSTSNPLGIRRFRYAGYPFTYGSVTGAEVHDDGEPFAAIIWRLIELFGARRADLFRYVVDGMNYTPSTPAYEHMRDGMLASVANGPSPADCAVVWDAFAQFGVGVGAQGIVTGSGVQIVESFAKPPSCN